MNCPKCGGFLIGIGAGDPESCSVFECDTCDYTRILNDEFAVTRNPFQAIACECGETWTQEMHTVRPRCARWPTIEQMIVNLRDAGWKPRSATVWCAPNGSLFLGPYCAWKALRDFSKTSGRESPQGPPT